jgi:hypothetical protein
VLIFHVLRRTFARHAAEHLVSADMLAFTCALIWSVHTLNSEVVNYLAERTESLMALFYLLGLSCAITALESSRALRWELCAVVAAICAVNSKEPAVTLPVAIVLWDRIFAFPTLRAAWSARRRLYLSVTAACLVFAFLVRLVHVSGTDVSSWSYLINRAADLSVSPWTYLMNQAPIIGRYLWLSIWPANLVLDYGFAQPVGVLDVWPALLFVSGLLAGAVLALKFSPLIGFWAAWFFLTLGPDIERDPDRRGGWRRTSHVPSARWRNCGRNPGPREVSAKVQSCEGPAPDPRSRERPGGGVTRRSDGGQEQGLSLTVGGVADVCRSPASLACAREPVGVPPRRWANG